MSASDRVAVGYLHPDDQIAPGFHHSLVNLMVWDWAHERRVVMTLPNQSGANVSKGRNQIVRAFLAQDHADWLWMVDSDMTFEPDTLERLMMSADPAERPIVGGLCFAIVTCRDDDGQPQVDSLRAATVKVVPTIYQVDLDGGEPEMRRYEGWTPGLCQVAGTGTACLLVHRTVFEKIDNDDPYRWFREERFGSQRLSEDLTFCVLAGHAGFPIWVDTDVQTGHCKTWTVTAKDFKPDAVRPDGHVRPKRQRKRVVV